MKSLDVIATIGGIAAATAVVWAVVGRAHAVTTTSDHARGTPQKLVEGMTGVTTSLGTLTEGVLTAQIAVIEFSDFQCPFCGRYAAGTYGQISHDFIAPGRIRYAFRNFPLESPHPLAYHAAEAAECAKAQGKFWEMHDWLFSHQNSLVDPELKLYAHRLKLRPGAFEKCLADGDSAEAIDSDKTEGQRLGVVSTPTFFIGRISGDHVLVSTRITGALPFSLFKKALDTVLTQAAEKTS